MAKLPESFINNDDGEMLNFAAVPKAKYIGKMTDSEWIKNSTGTGSHVKCTFTIMDKKYKNRKLIKRLNLVNNNDDAVRIANIELNSIKLACGKAVIRDTEELHGIPIVLDVDIVPDNRGEDYPKQNKIMGYEKIQKQENTTDLVEEENGSEQKMPWDE